MGRDESGRIGIRHDGGELELSHERSDDLAVLNQEGCGNIHGSSYERRWLTMTGPRGRVGHCLPTRGRNRLTDPSRWRFSREGGEPESWTSGAGAPSSAARQFAWSSTAGSIQNFARRRRAGRAHAPAAPRGRRSKTGILELVRLSDSPVQDSRPIDAVERQFGLPHANR